MTAVQICNMTTGGPLMGVRLLLQNNEQYTVHALPPTKTFLSNNDPLTHPLAVYLSPLKAQKTFLVDETLL